jgi:hypothetical protein
MLAIQVHRYPAVRAILVVAAEMAGSTLSPLTEPHQ